MTAAELAILSAQKCGFLIVFDSKTHFDNKKRVEFRAVTTEKLAISSRYCVLQL